MELECYGRRTRNQLCVDRRKCGQPVDLLSEQTHTIGISITRGNHRQAAPRPGAVPVPWLEQTLTRVKFKWHVWFASRCPGRRLSTWPTTAVSCPTALGALCGQLTFRLAWCHEHSAVMATELLQPRDLACGTLPFQLRNPDITHGLYR